MKGRRRLDKSVEPFVVTAADGTKFRCSIAALGRETDPRWVLFDSDGVQYIGPPVESDKSPEAVERLVSAWWEEVKATRGAPTASPTMNAKETPGSPTESPTESPVEPSAKSPVVNTEDTPPR
jgi:hypothetical protein